MSPGPGLLPVSRTRPDQRGIQAILTKAAGIYHLVGELHFFTLAACSGVDDMIGNSRAAPIYLPQGCIILAFCFPPQRPIIVHPS